MPDFSFLERLKREKAATGNQWELAEINNLETK